MKLKRLEEAADAALKTDHRAAARLAKAEKDYKAATIRVKAAEAAFTRARRELKQAKKAAKAAQKDARKASKRVSKARKKAKRKAQEPPPASGARKSTVGKKTSSRRAPEGPVSRVDSLSNTVEAGEVNAPTLPEPSMQRAADSTI